MPKLKRFRLVVLLRRTRLPSIRHVSCSADFCMGVILNLLLPQRLSHPPIALDYFFLRSMGKWSFVRSHNICNFHMQKYSSYICNVHMNCCCCLAVYPRHARQASIACTSVENLCCELYGVQYPKIPT
jgi:hypothetical protein